MSWRRPSNASSRVTGPPGPVSVIPASTSTMGRRRLAAAIASPSRVCAFSRTRSLSSSAWKEDRSATRGSPGSPASPAAGCPASAVSFMAASIGTLVRVVPPPPGVRWVLRIALGRVLPLLLPPEHGHVQVAPGAAECLVAAVVEEVGAEHLVAVAEERIRAVPLVHAEVGVEVVGHRVPGMRPAHPRLQAGDVGLRRARGVGERGVPGVQVRDVADLVGHQGAAGARVVGPAVYAGLEERAVDDKLAAALEQA